MANDNCRFRLLCDLDSQELVICGLFAPGNQRGMIRLYKCCTNRSSNEEHRHVPIAQPNIPDDAFVSVPDYLISKETLIYVGCNEDKAQKLWDRWDKWPRDDDPHRETDENYWGLKITFEDFITHHIGASGSPDTDLDDDSEWTVCLTAYGLAKDVQDAILDPLFK